MKLKNKRNETLDVRANAMQSHPEEASTNHTRNHDEIRRRAFEIYLERGGLPGNELDDWLEAERELEPAAPARANGFSIEGKAR
jgi:DUF2934 family protein